jgi:hypothetical protein
MLSRYNERGHALLNSSFDVRNRATIGFVAIVDMKVAGLFEDRTRQPGASGREMR